MLNCGHKGVEIANVVLNFLRDANIEIKNCRGQCYDNASTKSGIYEGVLAHILKLNPLAEWITCSGHSLDSVGKWGAESCTLASMFFLRLVGTV